MILLKSKTKNGFPGFVPCAVGKGFSYKKSSFIFGATLAAGLAALGLSSARAANDAYSTDATSGLFSTSFTLGTNVPTTGGTSSPASGDSLFFGTETTGATTVSNDLTGFSFAGFTFNAGASAFTISGNAFTLTTGITVAGTNAEIINNAIATSGAIAINLSGGGGNLTLGGNLTGGGTITQTGSTSGVTGLALGGDNSGFTGSFTQVNSSSNRTAFSTAAAGSASAAWTFNRAVGGGVALNFGTGTINFGSLAGAGYIRNNIGSTTSTLSVGALNTNTTFTGLIQGNGTASVALTKVGTGTLTLSGANTYAGTTTVANGTLALAGTGSIGSTAVVLGDATANTSGVLQLGDASGASNLTLTSLTAAGTGTANKVVGGATATSTLTLSPTASYGAGFFGGTGTNQNNLALTTTGALTFTGAQTYTGPTQINAGSLTLSGAGAAANSAITLGAAGGGATLTALTISPATTSGTVTRAASLSVNGNNGTGNQYADLTQTGVAANTVDQFTGALNLNSGAARLIQTSVAGGNTQLSFGSLTRNPGTVFNVGNAAGVSALGTANAQNITFATAPTLLGGAGAIGTNTASVLPYAVVGGNLATYTAANGLQALTTFSTSITDGTVSANNVNLSNTGNVQTVNSGATVNSLTLGGSPTAAIINGTGTLTIASGAVNFTQASTLNVATLAFGANEGFLYVQNIRVPTINSVITGSGGLTVNLNDANNNTARLVLNGANTYTGKTTITGNNAGLAVNLTNSLALQNTTLDYNNYGGSVNFGNGTTTGQTAYTFGGLMGGQNLNLNNNNATVAPITLTVGGDNDSTTYNGVLSSTVAGGSLTKAGTGTLTLLGANTYNGTTTVGAAAAGAANVTGSTANGGTLAAGANGALGSGTAVGTTALTVHNGGTLLLTGTTTTGTAPGGVLDRVNNAAPISLGTTGGTGVGGTIAVAGTGPVLEGVGASRNAAGTLVASPFKTAGATSTVGLGALTLTSNSTLDFGGSTVGTLVFSSYAPGGFTLNLTGYTNGTASGTTISGIDGTDDRLIFNQDQTANIAAGAFTFNGATTGFSEVLLDTGFYELVVPVPEPGTFVGGLLLLGTAAWMHRRSLRVMASSLQKAARQA